MAQVERSQAARGQEDQVPDDAPVRLLCSRLKTHLMMRLRADYALVSDKKFKEVVKKYAEDEHVFFKEYVITIALFLCRHLPSTSSFSAAFSRLLELGVPTSQWVTSTPWEMQTLSEQKKD